MANGTRKRPIICFVFGISFQKMIETAVGITIDRLTAVHELDIFPYFSEARSASRDIKIEVPPIKASSVVVKLILNESNKAMYKAINNTAEILSEVMREILSYCC